MARPSAAVKWTRREQAVIAEYLRDLAADTHALLHLADASLCGDVAAILRARAMALESAADRKPDIPVKVGVPGIYAQT